MENKGKLILTIYFRSILILFSHLHLSLPKGHLPVGVHVKILKALISSSILVTCPAYLNLLDLVNGTNYEVPRCEASSITHSHSSWTQIFASASCFLIPLACVPPLMQETMLHNHIGQLAILLFYTFKCIIR